MLRREHCEERSSTEMGEARSLRQALERVSLRMADSIAAESIEVPCQERL